ncbi:MAG: ISAs1 family transposase [Desulfovibrionaceae bacterium]|nr:ISAs1 family transposase [Desulfovibrionaceae bacterium]
MLYAHFSPFGGPQALDLSSLRDTISEKVPDPRRTTYGHALHCFADSILIALLAILAGCKTRVLSSLAMLTSSGYLLFSIFQTSSADTFRRCLEKVPTDMLSYFLYEWLRVYDHVLKNLSLDGKTIRGSTSQSQKARHVVTAYDTDNYKSVSEVTIQEKEKELLKAMDRQDVTVRADALMCQTERAAEIVEKRGDYCFPVKGNQPNLFADLQYFFYVFPPCQTETIVEKGHGRRKTRIYRFTTDIQGLDPEHRWKGLKAVGCVTSPMCPDDGTEWNYHH